MENKSGMIHELIHELKRQAGPWKQELKDCVAEISTCLDSLVSPVVRYGLHVLSDWPFQVRKLQLYTKSGYRGSLSSFPTLFSAPL